MINDLDEVQFAYLLAPTFQFVNSAGKPITGGWMEVYIHGTRTKYYCVSDWDGTLHPFKIPLDSLGSNIVLASPANAYDVYVYNRFGSLIMSRYNVIPSTGGASGVIPATITIVSDDDTVNVSVSGSTYNLSIGDTVDKLNIVSGDVEELKAAIASGINQVQADWEQTDSSAVDYIKNKPDLSIYATNELVETVSGDIVNLVNEGDTNLFNTISSVSSNLETEIDNVYNTISNVSGDIITTVNVVSGALHDEMESVSGDLVELINTVSSEIPEQEQSNWTETDTSSPSYIKNKPDLSVYATHSEVNGVSGEVINVVSSVSSTLETNIENASGNLVDLINAVSSDIPTQMQSNWIEDDSSSPSYIQNKPTEKQLVAGDNIGITVSGNDVIISASGTDLSDYATHTEVNNVSGEIINVVSSVSSTLQDEIDNIPEQVNSDWNAVSGKAEILNKPDLSVYATNASVNSVSSILNDKINSVSSAIPDVSEFATQTEVNNVSGILENEIQIVSAAIPEVGEFATHSEVNNVSGAIINIVNSVSTTIENDIDTTSGNLVDLIEEVSANIPQAQVQSDWTEDNTSSPAYIKNKPNESTLIAGDNISIVASGDDYVISASGTDLSDYATHTEVNNVSGTIINAVNAVSTTLNDKIDTVSSSIPDVSEFATHTEVYNVSGSIINVVNNEVDTLNGKIDAVSGSIPDVSSFATRTEVNGVSGVLETEIQIVSAAIPDISNLVDNETLESVSGNIITTVNNVSSILNNNIETTSGELVELITTVSSEIPEQEQSNWTETDTSSPAYIKNKPEESKLIAGDNIGIIASGSDFIISASGVDTSEFATHSEVNNVSGILDSEIQTVSASIPDVSDFTTHSEVNNVSGSIISVVNNVSSTLDNKIDAVSSSIPVVTGFVTETQLTAASGSLVNYTNEVSGSLQNQINNIPEQVNADWNSTSGKSEILNKPNLSVYATNSDLQLVSSAIPDVSNLATKTEVNSVSSILENEIQTISGAIPEPFEGYTSPSGTSYIDNVNYTIEQSNSAIDIITINDWNPTGQMEVTSSPDFIGGFTARTNEIKFTSDEATSAIIRVYKEYNGTEYIEGEFDNSDNVILNLPDDYLNREVWFYYDGWIPANITIWQRVGQPIETEIVRELAWKDDVVAVSASIPDVSDFVSEGELVSAINVITSTIPQAQVQSNWEETDTSDPSYIQNKPEEVNIVAGNNISIVASGSDLIISASGSEPQPTVPNVDIVSPSGSIVVNSSVDPLTNTKTFSIDVATVSGVEYGQFYATGVTGTANLAKTKGNLLVNNGRIQLHKGQSYHVTIRGTYTQTTLANELSFFNYNEYISFRNIAVNVNKTISAGQYWEISYDLYNISANTDYIVSFNNISNAVLSDVFVEVHSLAGGNGTGGSASGVEYTAGYGIQILNDVISVSGINPQVNADWNAVSGVSQVLNKPDEVEIVAGSGINITETNNQLIISSTVTGGGATYQEGYGIDIDNDTINVNTAVIPNSNMVSAIASAYASGGGGSGVNYNAGDHIDISNNTISVTGITELVAGTNITITMNSDSAIISAAGGQQIQSNWDEWDSSSPAYIQNKPSIPQDPVQSDWNETDPYSLAYIKNKPNITDAYTGASGIAIDDSVISLDEPLGIVAGSGINIVIEGDSAIICVSGEDETLLYSGANVTPSSTAIPLSGNLNDFNSVKFYWTANNYVGDIVDEIQCDNDTSQLTFMHPAGVSNLWIQFLALNCPTGVNKNSLTLLAAKQINFGEWSNTTWSTPIMNTNVGDTFNLSKVVGIHRKA